jgi:ABC-type uncharacterized transport system involved in gliding motility auxiliary subunit
VALMNGDMRRFAPFGLYLAALAALVSAALYIIQREWNIYLQISLGLIVLGLALFAILDPDRARVALTGRQAKYGSNALVMSIAFIGILVVVNYLGSKNSKRWDLTEDKANTLAAETVATLKSLPETVTARAFFTVRVAPETAQTLLDQYKFESDGKFDYSFIDPEADPLAAQAAKITRDGMIVLSMGAKQEPVEVVTEKEITAGLVRLMSSESRAVYFLTGHGERELTATAEDALSSARQVLESKNYKVDSLNLLTSNAIPVDAKVIVIAGPQQPVTQNEVSLLEAYMVNGGSLIVMEEPLPVTQFGDQPDPLADYLQQKWGVTLGRDLVVDTTSQSPTVAFANQYGSHAITEKLQGLSAYFPTVRSVQITTEIPGYTAVELALTADQAWAESDLAGLQDQNAQIQPDEGVDLIGRVPMAVAAQNDAGKERLVVFGDVDFATDANYGQLANGDLLINSVDWAAEQENLINLTPKDQIQRILIPAQQYTMGLILFGSVFLLPGLVLLGGIVVWIQRRKRG